MRYRYLNCTAKGCPSENMFQREGDCFTASCDSIRHWIVKQDSPASSSLIVYLRPSFDGRINSFHPIRQNSFNRRRRVLLITFSRTGSIVRSTEHELKETFCLRESPPRPRLRLSFVSHLHPQFVGARSPHIPSTFGVTSLTNEAISFFFFFFLFFHAR